MRTVPLRVLTWGTAAAAVSSAIWLSTTAIVCSAATSADIDIDDLISPAAAPAAGPSASTGTSSTSSGDAPPK